MRASLGARLASASLRGRRCGPRSMSAMPAAGPAGAAAAAAAAEPADKLRSPALSFEILATSNRARASRMILPHFACETPMFMPVGTQGSVKGLTSQQLEDLDCHVILGNTYHLENRPGSGLVAQMGGLHEFMRWPRGMLTDSGGFQMVSLLHLAEITEDGVTFQSPVDGARMLLTPEHSIGIQNRIGADIIMALDDVVPALEVSAARFAEATHRTLRWIDRCVAAHGRPAEQSLFGIVQGGMDTGLRQLCLEGLVARDLPGYAIGGLVGGEDKSHFWRIVAQCTKALPAGKPRYVMGVGYPLDIVCSALGADMYDSVYPTRTGRFGTALVPEGVLRLRNSDMATDQRPIDPDCGCMVCKRYTRAFLHHTVTKETVAGQLVSYHNVAYMMRLMREMRAAIVGGTFPDFVRGFVARYYGEKAPEQWVVDALNEAGIAL